MSDTVRLAGGQGFYGDAIGPLDDLLAAAPDYVVLEALAELTLAILSKDRARDETLGWTRDLPAYLVKLLPAVLAGQTTVITNAGGINPLAALKMVRVLARRYGLQGLKVACVLGDDVRRTAAGLPEGFPAPPDLVFANAYLGARPVVEALEAGADLVITGRVADAALFLAPLVHRHGWGWRDWDRLAAGTVVGHLLECSGQVTGGNHAGEWWTVPDPERFGFPVADVARDGSAVIRKPAGTGGRVDIDTVRQQLLYEVHDPSAYLAPDVAADLTTVALEDLGADRVRVTGATGRPANGRYKVVGATEDGWLAELSVAFAWPDAEAKARATADLARRRVELAGIALADWHVEVFGVGALHGTTAAADPPEVVLRLAWACQDEDACGQVARHIVPLGLSGPPPGMGSANRARPRPSTRLRLHSGLVPREAVDAGVRVVMEEL
jgi:hypothetical protein